MISLRVFPLVSGNMNIPKRTEMAAIEEKRKKVPESPRLAQSSGKRVTMMNC